MFCEKEVTKLVPEGVAGGSGSLKAGDLGVQPQKVAME